MAEVTLELRTVLAIPTFSMFDFTYKCDDAAWKDELEQAIITYYYFEEIGQETVDRWKQRLINKMQLIMPYYNNIHNAALLNDPYKAAQLQEVMDQTTTGTTSEDRTADLKATDYPQHAVIDSDILSNRTVNDSTSEVTGTNSLLYTKTVEGLTGKTYSELYSMYKKSLDNITFMVIQELKPLFILVY